MAVAEKKTSLRYTNKGSALKVRPGGHAVVSRALVKPGSHNLVPNVHVKRGDMVMLITGPNKSDKKLAADDKKRLDRKNAYRGTIGKVLNVFPSTGKVIVEGINLITCATKAKSLKSKAGLVQKEGPIYASKVMLYCAACKKPTRIKVKAIDKPKGSKGPKHTRICHHCKEAFDA